VHYSIVTFGCRVNQADSLRLEEHLRDRGAIEAPSSRADLVIVNTCSVTATADQGARQTIRRIARENPSARVIVTGCYATRRPDEVGALPGVLHVVRNADKDRLLDRIDGLVTSLQEATTAERFGAGDGPCGAGIQPGVAGRTAFTLRVQTGCEQACAYCIIPTTRGSGRSMPVAAVVAEVERIASAGFLEIALAGVHLGSYGRDLTPPASLPELLRALAESRADVLFRISSLEPMDCTPAVVDVMADSGGRFAPHFHLPLQHASDRVLTLMRREYTLAEYRALVDGILERIPHASIGSDMIAGFPGEEDADFAANLAYLPASGLSHLHVFPYSDRPGTAASVMAGKVAGPVVRERSAALRAIGGSLSRRFRQSQVGTERPGLTIDDGTQVVTDNYLKVRIAPGARRNERVVVRIDDVQSMTATRIKDLPSKQRAAALAPRVVPSL
jgi:threonylcarbamoyladenosine tRNA methylthiotransferase MtaB